MVKHDPAPDPAAEDETRRKFREALARKNEKASTGSGHEEADGRRSRAHGPVQQRRQFRRKSG